MTGAVLLQCPERRAHEPLSCPLRRTHETLSSPAMSEQSFSEVPFLSSNVRTEVGTSPCPPVYSSVSTLSHGVLTSLYPVLQCTHESVPVLQCIDESVPVLQCTHESLPCPTMYCRVCTLCYNVLTSLYPVLQGTD